MKVPSSVSSSASSSIYRRRFSPTSSSSNRRRCTPSKPSSSRRSSVDSLRSAASTSSVASPPSPTAVPDASTQNLLEGEYREDIKRYMHDMESSTMASVELIDMQPELQWYMRPYLVDFLIEIHQQHRLRPETLYLAINIVDRYVSKRIVFKKHYQLVGCAALWIAAKFEDAKDRVPTVQELCSMCCGAYDESAFIQMEGHVLSTIGWVVGHPTAESWLRTMCIAPHILEEQKTQNTARFVMELTLFHRAFILFKSSDVASASLLLARYITARPRRPEDETADTVRIAQMLDQHLAEHLDAISTIVVKKYANAYYSRSSSLVREWYLSGRRFNPASWPSPPRAGRVPAPISPSGLRAMSLSSPSRSTASEDSFDDLPVTPTTPAHIVPPQPPSADSYVSLKGQAVAHHSGKPGPMGPRQPLNPASWEMNVNPVPVSTYIA